MAQGDIETYYEGGTWTNKCEGSDRAFGAGYGTKDEAVAQGREAAQTDGVEHLIKNQDGTISERTATAMTRGTSPANQSARPPASHPPSRRLMRGIETLY